MKTVAVVIVCLLLTGCTSSITWTPVGGVLEATNYEIRETYKNGKIVSRVYSPADKYFTDGLKIVTNNLGAIAALLKPPEPPEQPEPPAPVPTPTPVPLPPAPGPYPAPVPTPIPVPVPVPVASTVFTQTGTVITLNMDTLPGSMRAAGFGGTDGGIYYAIAHIVAFGPGLGMVTHPELNELNTKKDAIANWFDAEIVKVAATMKANPTFTFVAITNDGRGPDKLGFRLGPPILRRLAELGIASDRMQLGSVLPESAYGDKKR
jgi:hypothetical protein